jgi:TonB family protein
MVSFMIQEDGTVTDGKVIKSVSPELDQEALRLVSIMPKWAPGSIGGKHVPMRYTMPVIFKLE